MRAQQNPVVDVEGILHIPCGVIRRKVQLCEVKIVIFDFGPFKGCEAQSNKRIADFAIYLGKRVELAGRQLDNARKGNVNGFVFNAAFALQMRQALLFVLQVLRQWTA